MHAWIALDPGLRDGLDGIAAGSRLVVLTWLHLGDRDVLRVHPRDDLSKPVL